MSAPSFSSFPPSFTSFPELDPGPSSRPSTTATDKAKERKQRKKDKLRNDQDVDRKHKKSKHSPEKDKEKGRVKGREKEDKRSSRHRSRSNSLARNDQRDEERRQKVEEDRQVRADHALESRERLVYFSDRKGDSLNAHYGGLHAGDVPKYRLVAGGRSVLGLRPGLSVVHRGRHGLEIAPYGRRKMPALTDSSSRRKLMAPPTRRLIASAESTYKYPEIDGFLRIRGQDSRRDIQDYREVDPSKQDDSDESDSSAESATSDEDSETPRLTSLQATLKTLEESLTSNPEHIPTWLSLLSHTLGTVPEESRRAAKARADISVSLLSRALGAHSSNSRSRVLRLKFLRAGEEIWDDRKLYDEWEKAVQVNDVEVWLAWLDWRVRTPSYSLLEDVVRDSTRISRALGSTLDEVGQVRLLWRVSVALRDAGYVERATAVFQAQAEWLFCTPPALRNHTPSNQLSALEDFWDAEVPRLGEVGASGWAAWEASGRLEQETQMAQMVQPSADDADPFSRWANSEMHADHALTFSLRSADDDADDPYAVVLFSDIRPFLFPLRGERAKDVFRRAWLAFLGLHVPGFLASTSEHFEGNADDRWAYEHLAGSSHLQAVFPQAALARRIAADAHAGVLVGREREYGDGFGPVKDWGYGTIGPLDAFGFNTWTMWGAQDVKNVDHATVREVFKWCKSPGNDHAWDALCLAFEASLNIKGALKTSKSFLATAPSSLPHWTAHARLESIRGRLNDARKVYQTVLVESASDRRPGECAMWRDWAQMEWLAEQDEAAIRVILRSSQTSGSGGTAILRAKRSLEALANEQDGNVWQERNAWIQLAALLELLTSSPQAAASLFDAYLETFHEGTPAHENLTIALLSMLYNHIVVLKKPSPPALLRDRVERAVDVYPNNTAIVGMFLEAEKGQGVWGRVRTMLGETAADGTRKEKGIARRFLEVWIAGWEKGRWEAEVERIRSALSAAVEDDRTRGSAVLWRLVIAFEIRAKQPEHAKKLLFRAVHECPHVKALYLLAFGPLRVVFNNRELRQWADTMAERGIRMRAGLDEVAGDWTDGGEENGSASDAGEAEIEERARELRRLRPY
ncbi:NRDE-2, necessary for RNA interference-domain-containing protein [Epithele typhae]|uniref:NRDE-2, necessary for RNA interference-domain-containing protein n=1 Tax=Epithele typhae TaxID=378194 RepID=UPI0020080532|nr:NRDE-2, necessary for RNA interference-domain-containing protein [Epithele typhae]KAH9944116.1 NRDE-2, necessary for RNA interference-domain-containing protein [Epithele typhae]